MNYKELKIRWGDETFIFVTRGKSKEFTAKEAIEYLNARDVNDDDVSELVKLEENSPNVPEEKLQEKWTIPDSKERIRMFFADIANGLDYCRGKYGVSDCDLIRETRRLAPHFNVENING